MSEDRNLIFERGYSRDDTWTRIQKVAANHPLPKSEALRQTGCGKGADARAEIANSVRLVYPMGERAMQFLNLCANKVFGLIFTGLLGQPVKDTLCGNKEPSRAHRKNIAANRSYFGDSDPFGDFDSLFGGAKLSLKVADIPVRYRERSDGETYIQLRRRAREHVGDVREVHRQASDARRSGAAKGGAEVVESLDYFALGHSARPQCRDAMPCAR